jgi:hypothetical protein
MLAFAMRASEPEGHRVVAIAASTHVYVERALWRISDVVVPGFVGESIFELPIVCAPAVSALASAWLSSPSDSDATLAFRVRGLVQYVDDAGRVETMRLPESLEARFDLSFETWRRAFLSAPSGVPSPTRGVHA